MFKSSTRPAKQAGFTLIELLIGVAIVGILAAVLLATVLGGQGQTQISEGQRLITTDIPTKLTAQFINNGRTYVRLTANAAGKKNLTDVGVDPLTPWSDTWTISTAGTVNSVAMTFPTTSATPNAADAALNIAKNICTDATPTAGTACTGINPRFRMITGLTPNAANIVVTYGIPR